MPLRGILFDRLDNILQLRLCSSAAFVLIFVQLTFKRL